MSRKVCLLIAAAILAAPFAHAKDHERGDHPKIEIDELKGELLRLDGAWVLEVRYEVEVKGTNTAPPLDLVLFVTEHGRQLAEQPAPRRHGGDPERLDEVEIQPLEIVIPLDRPSDVDDHEVEFEARVLIDLPPRSFYDPDELRLHAAVYAPETDQPLKTKDKKIKFKKPHHRRVHIGVGVGIGPVSVGVGW